MKQVSREGKRYFESGTPSEKALGMFTSEQRKVYRTTSTLGCIFSTPRDILPGLLRQYGYEDIAAELETAPH
jgi:hypothetical protein